VLGTALVCGLAVVGYLLTRPRKFEAAVTVAPIPNSKQLNLPAGLAGSLLGAATNTGLQATPIFVARLARLTSVLNAVALTRVPGDSTHFIIERVVDQPLAEIRPHMYATEIDKVLLTTVDRESGTVTLRVVLPDSALARTTVNTLVAAVRRTFARTNKSQGSELREAQVTRVDSASRQLKQAQAALVDFNSSNRVVQPFSAVWVEGQRLQSNVQVAQSVYTAAVSDLQSAQGKELEDAPALVILDSVPAFLPPRSRGTVSFGIIALCFGAILGFAFVVVREAAANATRHGDAEAQRLLRAISRLPVVRGPVFRWFVREPQAAPDKLLRP
jgi:uncharacterized protein involved in exopolysaccharide biosynthesis